MNVLGMEINQDGKTIWRNNGGVIERKALYAATPEWETVGEGKNTPHTPDELKAMCEAGGFGYEPAVELTSDVCMLHKCNGINSDAATWVDDPIVGEYERVEAPENWRDLIAEADEYTAGCQPGQTDIGEESDWEWYCYRETDEEGFLTGIEWLAAKYVGE